MIEQQLVFLERYLNEKGDVDKVLKSMSLEMNHFLSWRKDREFDSKYKDTQRVLISHLNCENYIMGLRRLNEILNKGYQEEVVSVKQRVIQKPILADDDDDNIVSIVEYEVDRKSIKKPIPPQMISLALQQNSLIQAINTLSTQGILPDKVARQLMAKSEEIANQMQSVFEAKDDNQKMSENKAIELIKKAILKGVD